MHKPLTKDEFKLLMRAVKLTLRAPVSIVENRADAGASHMVIKAADIQLKLSRSLIARARQEGIWAIQNGCLIACPEARLWLRRALSDPDDAFIKQHGDHTSTVIKAGSATHTVTVNLSASPLSALARLKGKDGTPFLPKEALAAGERLHADFTRGQLQPRITQSYEPRLSGPTKGSRGAQADLNDSAVSARIRVAKALNAIGPELSGVALDVCCFEKGLETVERERQWPPRSAKLMLKTALLSLHRHYTPEARRNMRHWGEGDYRPELSA